MYHACMCHRNAIDRRGQRHARSQVSSTSLCNKTCEHTWSSMAIACMKKLQVDAASSCDSAACGLVLLLPVNHFENQVCDLSMWNAVER